jgi:WD40 repeat protein
LKNEILKGGMNMVKKKLLIWGMALLLVFTAGQTLAAQAEQKGARIELDEESETPKLKFLDEAGKSKKEISLKTEKRKGTVVEDRKDYVSGKFEVEFEAIKKIKLSPNSKYALMDNSTVEWFKIGGSTPNGKVILYDVNGNTLFEKKYPRGVGVLGYPGQQRMIVSDNGTVALITNDSDEGIGNTTLHVYDKTGKELFTYPETTTEEFTIRPMGDMEFSPNGRYLSADVEFQGVSVTVFIDTETKRHWKSDRTYGVYRISDDGRVEASYYIAKKQSGRITIDLKQKLGE